MLNLAKSLLLSWERKGHTMNERDAEDNLDSAARDTDPPEDEFMAGNIMVGDFPLAPPAAITNFPRIIAAGGQSSLQKAVGTQAFRQLQVQGVQDALSARRWAGRRGAGPVSGPSVVSRWMSPIWILASSRRMTSGVIGRGFGDGVGRRCGRACGSASCRPARLAKWSSVFHRA